MIIDVIISAVEVGVAAAAAARPTTIMETTSDQITETIITSVATIEIKKIE